MSDMDTCPSAPPLSAGLLDLEQLESLIVLGAEDFRELLGDVIGSVPGQITRIHADIHAGDAPHLRAHAHELRGMLLYFGCQALAMRLDELEHHPQAPSAEAAAIHADLETLWHHSLAAIQAWQLTVPEFAA